MSRCLDVLQWQLLWAFPLGPWPSLKGRCPPLLATPSLVLGHHHWGPYCSLSAYQVLLLLGLLASWKCHAHSYNTGLAKAHSLALSLSPFPFPSFLPLYYLYKRFTLVDRSQGFFSRCITFSFLCSLSSAVLLPFLKPPVKVACFQLHGRYWVPWPARRTSDNTRSCFEVQPSRKVQSLFHLHCLLTLSLLIVQELLLVPAAVKVS